MSSIVKRQANLHDSFESNSSSTSNKRKRVIDQNPIHNNLYLNMPPPAHAAQELIDHPLQKHDTSDEAAAAALLSHMHLMHHDDHPPAFDDIPMHADYHDNGIAAGPLHVADHDMLQHRAIPEIARENSGSSDASTPNYFSGDSDLTAEPVMGCAADEDGAKSSNSGSSTPFKVPRQASLSTDHAQAIAAGVGQGYPISLQLQTQHDESAHDKQGEAAQLLPTAVASSTSTASTSMQNCKSSPDSKLLASSQMMHMHAARTINSGCHTSQAEGADSAKGSESWLELRLGFSAELQHKLTQNIDASQSSRDAGSRRTSRESMDDTTASTPVTLQLLPNNSKVAESSAAVAEVMRPSVITGSGPYGNLPAVYHPMAHTFSHALPKFDENHHLISRLPTPDHQQILLNQSKDPAAAALPPVDHQRFLMNQSNDPIADLRQSNEQHLSLTAYDSRIVYDQVRGYTDNNDQRRWLAAETSDMMIAAAPTTITAARQIEIYRPTASLGWPTSNADTRSWSANSFTQPVHLQRTMSWQGLLRSMTTDPLLHPLPDLPMCTFDAGTELSVSRGRHHMFPAASANRPPSNPQRLRLATSRRSAGLWFSLQEAHHFSNENMEDEEEQHSAMQKVYLRIRDGKMQISVLQSYLLRKLESSGFHHYTSDEVEITCRGKTLAPTLTIQHVRDTIWLNKDVELNEAIGFRYTKSYLNDSHSRVMALCYQRHTTQSITLNLLKT